MKDDILLPLSPDVKKRVVENALEIQRQIEIMDSMIPKKKCRSEHKYSGWKRRPDLDLFFKQCEKCGGALFMGEEKMHLKKDGY